MKFLDYALSFNWGLLKQQHPFLLTLITLKVMKYCATEATKISETESLFVPTSP